MPSRKIQPKNRTKNLGLLNPQQRMFVHHLLSDESFNATVAARNAGYKAPSQQANKLMKNPVVSAYIGKAITDRKRRLELNSDDVLSQLQVALTLDPMDVFERTEDGKFIVKDLDTIPEGVRRCISKIKSRSVTKSYDGVDETTVMLEIEFMSKDAMMGYALKHLGLVEPEKNGPTSVSDVDRGLIMHLLDQVEGRSNVVELPKLESLVVEEAK